MILQVLSPTLITHPKTVQCIHPSAYPGCETIQHQLMHMFSVSLGLRLLSLPQDSTRTGPDAQPGSGFDSESGLGQCVPLHIGHPNYLQYYWEVCHLLLSEELRDLEYLDRLMSCTAIGFMPGTLFPGPLLLGSAFLIVLTADTSILPKSIKGSSLVIKYGRGKLAISSRQSEKSHYFSYEEFCFLCKAKCCSDFF